MKTKEMAQEALGIVGTTTVTAVNRDGNTVYVLTNNTVFNRFNFVQEYLDEDSAWTRAEAISAFEDDFKNTSRCYINENNEIELCVNGKNKMQIYQIHNGELWKQYLGEGLRVSIPHKIFIFPAQTEECINYINSKIKAINVNAFSLLSSPLTRVEINEGDINRSYNIDTTMYNSIKHRLKRCGNIEVAHNLIIANGGIRHQEAMIDRL